MTDELRVLHRIVCEYQAPADETLHQPHLTGQLLFVVGLLALATIADLFASPIKERLNREQHRNRYQSTTRADAQRVDGGA